MATHLPFAVVFSGALAALAMSAGCASTTAYKPTNPPGPNPTYLVRGEQLEGCECDIYCPCLFEGDATMDQCRGVMAWKVADGGHYGDTCLSGLTFAASITKSGKNLGKALGHWEGALFISDQATPQQREAVEAMLRKELGAAFSKLEVKSARIEIKGKPGAYELMIGQTSHLKLAALKGANGMVPVIENPPSPLALARTYCARAEVNTYDDGEAKWDFAGHNAYYGAFEMKSK